MAYGTLFVLAFALPWQSVAAKRYDNGPFGFSLSLPENLEVCKSRAPSPNHGLSVKLARGRCDRLFKDEVDVFAAFNVPYEVHTSEELGSRTCQSPSFSETSFVVDGAKVWRCDPITHGGVTTETYFFLKSTPGVSVESWRVFYVQAVYRAQFSDRVKVIVAQILGSMSVDPW